MSCASLLIILHVFLLYFVFWDKNYMSLNNKFSHNSPARSLRCYSTRGVDEPSKFEMTFLRLSIYRVKEEAKSDAFLIGRRYILKRSVACVTWNFCLPELRVADAHVRVLLNLSSSFLLDRVSIYSCWSAKRTISVFQISSRELILAVRWHCQTRFECKDVNFAQWM